MGASARFDVHAANDQHGHTLCVLGDEGRKTIVVEIDRAR
jgi:hypothetical protein